MDTKTKPLDILCTTDLSEASTQGIRDGVRLAADLGASVTVLFVVDTGPAIQLASSFLAESQQQSLVVRAAEVAQETLDKLCKEEAQGDVRLKSAIVHGPRAADAICKYAKEQGSHMIAIATHGAGGLEHMVLGSVAERVVRLAGCPVLVVRQPA